jgi:hypothetical protein
LAKLFRDQGGSNNVIEINDMKIDLFKEFLRFLYTANVKNLHKHAVGLFRAAMKVLWSIGNKIIPENFAKN